MWQVIRPDRVSFFYNAYGILLKTQDRYRNTILFGLQVAPGTPCDSAHPAQCTEVADVTDQGGRSFHLDYYTSDDYVTGKVSGHVSDIKDHSGHMLTFTYYGNANLRSVKEIGGGSNADGTALQDRTWMFNYTDKQGSPFCTDAGVTTQQQPTACSRLNPDPNNYTGALVQRR